MTASYHIDPYKYSLEKFKKDLLERVLIPSRVSLKNDLLANFDLLIRVGIHNLGELIAALKTKAKLGQFSTSTGINEDYLVLLRREANSYLPNPVPLQKFSGFDSGVSERLANMGFKNSKHIFEYKAVDSDLGKLSRDVGVHHKVLIEMQCLSDLVRAYGIGPVFARILYDSGINSIQELRSYSPQQVIDIYQEYSGKKADFSVSDIQFSLNLIQMLDLK